MNTELTIDFIKENCQTIADLKKRCDERRLLQESQSVARDTNKLNSIQPASLYKPYHLTGSLMPQTFNFTKINNARINLETEQAFKDLGIEIL
jgi:cell division protein YceG involved in septum cleavage